MSVSHAQQQTRHTLFPRGCGKGLTGRCAFPSCSFLSAALAALNSFPKLHNFAWKGSDACWAAHPVQLLRQRCYSSKTAEQRSWRTQWDTAPLQQELTAGAVQLRLHKRRKPWLRISQRPQVRHLLAPGAPVCRAQTTCWPRRWPDCCQSRNALA